MANTLKKSLKAALGIGVVGSLATAEGSYRGYDTPPYEVVQTVGDAEIRAYTSHLVAEVTVRGAQRDALSSGFRILAGYIFGGNTSAASVAMTSPVAQRPSEKISMTSPVGQTGSDDLWTVTFTMPPEYTRETLPLPNNEAVRIVEAPAQRQIVLQFSGLAKTALLNQKSADLRAIAASAGLALGEGPFYYLYDGPMTLPWSRRNEVAYVVE